MIVFLMIQINGFSQINTNLCPASNVCPATLDTNDIIFKSKLMTLIASGLPPKDTLLSLITAQNHKILKSITNPDLVFIKIYNTQAIIYNLSKGIAYEPAIDKCNFVICYSCRSNKFYKFSGFENDDFLIFY